MKLEQLIQRKIELNKLKLACESKLYAADRLGTLTDEKLEALEADCLSYEKELKQVCIEIEKIKNKNAESQILNESLYTEKLGYSHKVPGLR